MNNAPANVLRSSFWARLSVTVAAAARAGAGDWKYAIAEPYIKVSVEVASRRALSWQRACRGSRESRRGKRGQVKGVCAQGRGGGGGRGS